MRLLNTSRVHIHPHVCDHLICPSSTLKSGSRGLPVVKTGKRNVNNCTLPLRVGGYRQGAPESTGEYIELAADVLVPYRLKQERYIGLYMY